MVNNKKIKVFVKKHETLFVNPRSFFIYKKAAATSYPDTLTKMVLVLFSDSRADSCQYKNKIMPSPSLRREYSYKYLGLSYQGYIRLGYPKLHFSFETETFKIQP